MSQEQNHSSSDRRDQVAEENSSKKMNRDESSANRLGQFQGQDEGQGQVLKVKEASINDLPPEMLLEILKCVDTRSLLPLRLVNRQWNSISTGILCHRPDAQVCFELTETCRLRRRGSTRFQVGKRTMLDFLRCLKKSQNCPIAHFSFDLSLSFFPTKLFDHPHFTKLLSHFSSSSSSVSSTSPKLQNRSPNPNQRVRGLSFKFSMMDDIILGSLTGKLRDLLLDKTPHVENLSLDFGFDLVSRNAAQVKLFPTPNQNVKNIQFNPGQFPVPVPIPIEFQLPHLKTLRFTTWTISNYSGILQDLLSAAVNLNKMYLHETEILPRLPFALQHFQLLQSLGKFHLLKNFDFHVNAEFLSKLTARPDFTRALCNLELEELGVSTTRANLKVVDHSQATTFISRLFESSKNSLRKLTMRPLGALTALQLPKFTNLTQLKLERAFLVTDTFFTPGVRALDIFPAVRHLYLPQDWCSGFPHFEFIPVFPSVKSLSVVDTGFTLSSVSTLDLLCPNLRSLRIHKKGDKSTAPELHFLPVGRQLWRLMKRLESLEVDIRVDLADKNSSLELDSCFTGISVENIQHLYQLGEEESESASELTAERKHPSILDMKSLTRFTVNHYEKVRNQWSKIEHKRFYTDQLTWVSQDYAFKLLPNLETRDSIGIDTLHSTYIIPEFLTHYFD